MANGGRMQKICGCMKALGCLALTAFLLFLLYKGWYWLAGQMVAQAPDTKLSEALEASGALFSGLAFLAAIGTLLLQREDLKQQREELIETRKELQGQKEQLLMQSNVMRKDLFEKTFFNIVALYTDIVNGIIHKNEIASILNKRGIGRYSKEDYNGKEFFPLIIEKIESYKYGDVDISDVVKNVLMSYSDKVQCYFRVVDISIEHIERSDCLTCAEKMFYVDIFVSQLSAAELHVLFYRGLQIDGGENVRQFLCKYGVLGKLEIRRIEETLVRLYPPEAYGVKNYSELLPTPPP